jgi:ankyrin repeat protein
MDWLRYLGFYHDVPPILKIRDEHLIQASKNNCPSYAIKLLEAGNTFSAKNSSLIIASAFGFNKVVEALLIFKAFVRTNQDSPLVNAAAQGRNSTISILLNHGADIHAQNGAALRYASAQGHFDTVMLLLDNGADVLFSSALTAASENGHEDVVELLLENGADVHEGDEEPLIQAAAKGHAQVVMTLLEYGADPQPALDSVEAVANKDIFFILKRAAGVSDDEIDLEYAVHKKDKVLIEWLIHHGASPFFINPMVVDEDVKEFISKVYLGMLNPRSSDAKEFKRVWN